MRESWNEREKKEGAGTLATRATQAMSSRLLDHRSYGVTIRALAWIFREFDVWAQVKLLFCSLMKFVFAGSFDYSWRLWDLEQLKEVLHQVKYF